MKELPKTLHEFILLIKSGQCPPGMTIDLECNDLGAEGARHLADALHFG